MSPSVPASYGKLLCHVQITLCNDLTCFANAGMLTLKLLSAGNQAGAHKTPHPNLQAEE